MARSSEHETSSIYEAAAAFRDRCLLVEGSLLFPGAAIWTAGNLGKLHEVFVGAPDESEQSFEAKFKEQVSPHGQLVTRLAGEVVAVHFLFPSNVSRRKRQLVSEVLSWGGDSLPDDPWSAARWAPASAAAGKDSTGDVASSSTSSSSSPSLGRN